LSCAQLKKQFELNIGDAYSFKAPYIPLVTLKAGKTVLSPNDKGELNFKSPCHIANNFTKWICIYHNKSYNACGEFVENLKRACKTFGISVSDPEYVEMNSFSGRDWVSQIESCDVIKNQYQFVLVFMDNKMDGIYKDVKRHSLIFKGYITQGVKAFTAKKGLSIASKIGLQLNSKLGGCTYKVEFNKEITDRNLMVVGVDSSHFKGKRTGVAMTATYDENFSKYYNEINLIPEEKKETLLFAVSSFLEKAVQFYFKKNKKLPGGIVIYRQGVSKEQKEILKAEMNSIDKLLRGLQGGLNFLKEKPLPYYYIIVNKKVNIKFFEKDEGKNRVSYDNPKSGLIICDKVTDDKIFEFYLQPQVVTQGTATPTNYHVAFGNLNAPNLVLNLTYGLCFLYPNWQGPVRVPAPLKASEKLSKLTAQVTKENINERLQDQNSFL